MINEIGNIYGKLTVIARGENDNNGKVRWICQCECGNQILTRGTDLRRGKVKTCGCSSLKSENSLIGQRFNRLEVLSYAGRSSQNKIQYLCKCDCGNEVIVIGAHLKSGNTKSCGCLKKEKIRENHGKEEIGKVYGRLTVLEFAESKNNNLYWKCKCECGNIVTVRGADLRNGNTHSCGCIKSHGEELINKILTENNILFVSQVSFPDLIYKSNLKYDFALLDKDNKIIRLIEFDGPQHFDKNNSWYSEEGRIRDLIKDSYAKDNNYPLVRIPYKEKNNLNLDMILSDKYLVKTL